MHAHGVPLRNEDGSIREWVGMNTDVTERKEAEAARALLAAVADSSQDAIISHDMEGTILSWNRGAEEIFGYRPEEVIGRDYRLLTPSATPEQTRALALRLFNGERIAPFEVVSHHRDGREIPVSVSLAALRDEAGRVVGVTAVARDITEPRRAAQALRESEQQLESILNNAAEAVVVISADGSIERFNLAAQRLFGYSVEDARGLNLRKLTVELAFDEAAGGDERPAAWLQPLMGGRREVTGRRKDGSIFPLELALSEIGMAPRPPRFTAVVRDITERKSWENRIYTLAYTDSLTGLPNRLLLRDRLEHAIARAQRNRTLVGVLFFDLDHFKAINDSYGHHMGDALLREIAVADHRVRARDRHGLPAGRRRVRAGAAGVARRGGRRRGRAQAPRGAVAALPHRRSRALHHADPGDQHLPAGRHRRGHAPAQRRLRHVPRQGERQERLPVLRGRGGRAGGVRREGEVRRHGARERRSPLP